MPETNLPRVRCAICNKPVDHLEWGSDPAKGNAFMIAYCHGDKQRMETDPHAIQRMEPELAEALFASEGIAFAMKRIGGGDA